MCRVRIYAKVSGTLSFFQAGKPIVTYGGFLNSMEFSTVPSSAEVNDVITAVLDGTDCIYLDVTMRSAHAVHCIQYASSLCRQGEAAVWEQQLFSELNYKVREHGLRGV